MPTYDAVPVLPTDPMHSVYAVYALRHRLPVRDLPIGIQWPGVLLCDERHQQR